MKHTRGELEKMSKKELIELVMSVADRYFSLLNRVEELERKAARTAAPFSKNRRKLAPQKPGRKVGQGKFEGRQAPSEEALLTLEEAGVKEEVCTCGGELEGQGFEFVSVTELPAIPPAVKGLF